MEKILIELRRRMVSPSRKALIVIVDDHEDRIWGMRYILEAWPNVECRFILHRSMGMPDIPEETDILLLDYDFDDDWPPRAITGGQIVRELKTSKFKGAIVGTTAREEEWFVPYAPWRFRHKHLLMSDWCDSGAATEFVDLISVLLVLSAKNAPSP